MVGVAENVVTIFNFNYLLLLITITGQHAESAVRHSGDGHSVADRGVCWGFEPELGKEILSKVKT